MFNAYIGLQSWGGTPGPAARQRYNGLPVPPQYFDEAMVRLRDKYLNVPIGAALHPLSDTAREAAKDQMSDSSAIVQAKKIWLATRQ